MVFAGCENKETERLNTELKELQKESLRLKEENKVLTNLKADFENQTVLNNEDADWAKHLVKSYGPSLWTVSQYDNPLPFKQFEKATPEFLIRQLNLVATKTGLPEIALVIIKDKTAFIKIIDDKHLTQGMGTSGAAAFLKSVAYTLSSVIEVNCVEFEFSVGDHAYPTELCP